MIASSRSSGSLDIIKSLPRCVTSKKTASFLGPTPRPSLISFKIARATTSREASSSAFGAYFSIKRSPLELKSRPPSPRAASEIKTPFPERPDGWNCTNSISSNGRP